MMQGDHFLEIRNLTKYFPIKKGLLGKKTANLKAVDDVSFHINKGETLGLVGESGCGKSTVGRLIMGLLPPTRGEIFLEGENIDSLKKKANKRLYRRIQIIFQDPYGSLNPRQTVRDIISEPLHMHHLAKGPEVQKQVTRLLGYVGLSLNSLGRFPHEFSGGQRQRIGIARALAVAPELIVCDEPVSALDVSIQSQILNLLSDLQNELNLTYLFIAHGLNVVKFLSTRICVMYLGKIVELAPGDEFYANPQHPYSKALISAIPIPNPKLKRERIILKGDVPSPIDPPPGCCFNSRCPIASEICFQTAPPFNQIHPNHFAACHMISSEKEG